jgi:hypothetical protein
VDLLSDQGEVDELDEHALQLGGNLAVLGIDRHVQVHDEGRCHGDLLTVGKWPSIVTCERSARHGYCDGPRAAHCAGWPAPHERKAMARV